MALPCTGFVASAFNSAPGVTDIEGWGDNSNNFYQQSLIWGCALARRLVPSLCLPSSPSLAAPVDHASHQRKCKPSVFPQCRSDCSTSGKTATSCSRTTKLFRCGLGDKWESQKLGAQISGSPLTAMLHFDCQPRNKKQTYFRRCKGNSGSMPEVQGVFWTVLLLEFSFQERRIGGMATDLIAPCLIFFFASICFFFSRGEHLALVLLKGKAWRPIF